MVYNFKFNTPIDLLNYCDKNKPAYYSKYPKIEGFTVLESWDETLDIIHTGWPEQRSDVTKIIDSISQGIGTLTLREEYINSTTGQFFDIGLVCQGKPECWFTLQETDEKIKGKNIVKVGFNTTVSSSVSIEAIIERGAAVLTLITLLEQTGHKVELTQYCSLTKDLYTFNGTLTLKTATQPLDKKMLIFWLTCPDSFRRCWFRVMENIPYAKRFGCLEYKIGIQSYGTPIVNYGQDESDIFISGVNSEYIFTRKYSIKWVKRILEKQGVVCV